MSQPDHPSITLTTDDAAQLLESIMSRYDFDMQRDGEISIYQAAKRWHISPKAAEQRLECEVRDGRMTKRQVMNENRRWINVYRPVTQ